MVLWAMLFLGWAKPGIAGTWEGVPIRLKTDLEDGGDIALDWGLRYEGWELSIHGDYPEGDYRLRLEGFHEWTAGWDGEAWGVLRREGNYSYDDLGLRTRWNIGFLSATWQWVVHHRQALTAASSYGYDGEDGLCRVYIRHGNCRWNFGLSRSVKDYELGDDDSCKDLLQAGWQWSGDHQRVEIEWQEWVGDYPQDAMANKVGDKIGVKWRRVADGGRVWEVKTEWRREKNGEGETEFDWKADFHTSCPVAGGVLRWGIIATRQNEAIDLLELEETVDGYKMDFRWRKTLGHRRSWWIGGEVEFPQDEKAEWGLKAQWDWPIGAMGFRLQLTADYQDSTWEAGGYLQMTYYF